MGIPLAINASLTTMGEDLSINWKVQKQFANWKIQQSQSYKIYFSKANGKEYVLKKYSLPAFAEKYRKYILKVIKEHKQ
ncbi:hypothetical protein [Aquibacillus kalidii]|uniref:hypothetical protein n=1 Tax=Aquibacillus kalidii TaxID=2762597 RepID=UPI00164932E2|nr:hypothetical protein [Aquibacillus kalidii]